MMSTGDRWALPTTRNSLRTQATDRHQRRAVTLGVTSNAAMTTAPNGGLNRMVEVHPQCGPYVPETAPFDFNLCRDGPRRDPAVDLPIYKVVD